MAQRLDDLIFKIFTRPANGDDSVDFDLYLCDDLSGSPHVLFAGRHAYHPPAKISSLLFREAQHRRDRRQPVAGRMPRVIVLQRIWQKESGVDDRPSTIEMSGRPQNSKQLFDVRCKPGWREKLPTDPAPMSSCFHHQVVPSKRESLRCPDSITYANPINASERRLPVNKCLYLFLWLVGTCCLRSTQVQAEPQTSQKDTSWINSLNIVTSHGAPKHNKNNPCQSPCINRVLNIIHYRHSSEMHMATVQPSSDLSSQQAPMPRTSRTHPKQDPLRSSLTQGPSLLAP